MLLLLRRAIVLALAMLVICGLAYPLAEVAIAQAFFPFQADGSLTAEGSLLIGQPWRGPRWFQGRPDRDDPLATGETNLGPRSLVLVQQTRALLAAWEREGVRPTEELITTSASGVDPDISPASALVQVPVVARATGVPAAVLRRLVERVASGPAAWVCGERVVDVLELNVALARLEATRAAGQRATTQGQGRSHARR